MYRRWSTVESRHSRMEETSRRIGRKLGEAETRIQQELQQVVDYLDKDVIPKVRGQSSRGLRVAAEKLNRLADLMDEQRRQKP
jgi:hypothetical protein